VNDAAAITARYIAVGKLLRGRPGDDPLWQRYRWIRLDDAVGSGPAREAY